MTQSTKTALSPLMEAIIQELRLNPDIGYGDLKAKLALSGHTLAAPIHYGRAKRMLGLTGVSSSKANVMEAKEEAGESEAVEVSMVEPEGSFVEEATAVPEVVPAQGAAEQVVGKRGRRQGELSLFLESFLHEHPKARFEEARAAAEQEGVVANPVAYSRARAKLGIARARRANVAAETSANTAQDHGREARMRGGDGFVGQLQDILRSAKALEAEQQRLESAVRDAIAVLSAALVTKTPPTPF